MRAQTAQIHFLFNNLLVFAIDLILIISFPLLINLLDRLIQYFTLLICCLRDVFILHSYGMNFNYLIFNQQIKSRFILKYLSDEL